MGSAYFEIQQFASFERGAQHVSPFDGACARRRAGEKQVARAVGDVARDVAQQFVHPEDHVARVPSLPYFAVDFEREVQLPDVAQLGDGDELRRHGGRVVESFGTLPRPSVGDRLALEVACREVDAQSDFGVETVGEARRDVARQSVDAYDQFAFVVPINCLVISCLYR